MNDPKDGTDRSVDEIISLNADDLDVEELEQRLELAAAEAAGCYSFDCGTHTTPPQ